MSNPIGQLLDALCGHLDDELERQENIRAICRSQGEAARLRDVKAMDARRDALTLLLREAVEAESERLRLVRRVVDFYELPVSRQTLTDLIGVVPQPWKGRLGMFQRQMRAVLEDTRSITRGNNVMMRRSLRIINDTLATLSDQHAAPRKRYDQRGEASGGAQPRSSMLDQKG